MTALDRLEARSIYILREAIATLPRVCMLWSMGKDSTVLLALARKAFLGAIPFPLIHVDTSFKLPEMIRYRDRTAAALSLPLLYGRNDAALEAKQTFPDGAVDRTTCCGLLKTQALSQVLNGTGRRFVFDHATSRWVEDDSRQPFSSIIVGARSDEEGSRSKERYFSPRTSTQTWQIEEQPPEFWGYFAPFGDGDTQIRVHPLLDWTELDVWEYIEREGVPVVESYFSRGTGQRYRSLGCGPCTQTVPSSANSVREIIDELRSGSLKGTAERSGRAQDGPLGTLETLRRQGYM